MKEIKVEDIESGGRLINFLRKLLPNAADSFIYKMLRKKNIDLNGSRADGKEILKSGDVINIWFSDDTYNKFAGEYVPDDKSLNKYHISEKEFMGLEKRILFENRDLIIINKLPGELSQKDSRDLSSVNEKLIAYMLSKGQITVAQLRRFHPSIINRLDRNTSGIMLFGKTRDGIAETSKLISSREVEKKYLCIVHDEDQTLPDNQKLHIGGSLIKDTRTNLSVWYPDHIKGGLDMSEDVTLLKRNHGLDLLLVEIHTGRSHQIRCSLSSFGFPVLFDPKYGNRSLDMKYYSMTDIRHQLLHSYKLKIDSLNIDVTAEPPAVFDKLMS